MDALVKRLSAGHDRVRYDEGAALLSMGIHSFMTLAEEAEAKERYKGIVLVRMNKVYQYLEDPKFLKLSAEEHNIKCNEKRITKKHNTKRGTIHFLSSIIRTSAI